MEVNQSQPVLQKSKTAFCPICQSKQLTDLLTIQEVPIICNVIWETREAAVAIPRGEIHLAFCEDCGHVFNLSFDPDKIVYDAQYENSLHFSARFQEYAEGLANYLINQYNLHNKKIIEIGSGKGEFLRTLCVQGSNHGIGFDPSYHPSAEDAHPNIQFIQDRYTEKYRGQQADLVLSRHVLEHLPQPAEFVSSLRATIGDHRETVVFMEVPNFAYMLRDTALWDLIYEHYSYFTASSITRLFISNDFFVINTAEPFESQFLFIEASPSAPHEPKQDLKGSDLEDLREKVKAFSKQSSEKLSFWKNRIEEFRSQGKKVVIWGSGSKGITFLNMLNVQDAITYVVDINPRKHGHYVTGTGQQIVPPEFLQDYNPDIVIVMNPIYKDEIIKTLGQFKLSTELLFAS